MCSALKQHMCRGRFVYTDVRKAVLQQAGLVSRVLSACAAVALAPTPGSEACRALAVAPVLAGCPGGVSQAAPLHQAPQSNSRSSGRTGFLSGMIDRLATSRGMAFRMSAGEVGGWVGGVGTWPLALAVEGRHACKPAERGRARP